MECRITNLVGVVSPIFDEDVQEGMYSSLSECHQKVDAVIDFSHPNNLDDLLKKERLYFVADRSKAKYIVQRFRQLLEQYDKEIALTYQLDLTSGKKIGIYQIQ